MGVLTVALGQARSVPGDLAANLGTAVRLVRGAAAAGARLLALPELFTCGYDLDAVARTGEEQALGPPEPGEAPEPGSALAPLARAAGEAGIWVVLGAALTRPEAGARPWNAVLVIDPTGVVAGHYAKAHLWGAERDVFSPGAGLVAVVDGGVRVGLGICYDAGFPEFARAHRRAGAHAVLYCSAFAEGDTEHRYAVYHPARAVENGVYALVSNAVGDLAGDHYFGRSGGWDPAGRPLTPTGAPGTPEGVRIVAVDTDETVRVRRELPYLAELRTDLLGAAPLPHVTVLQASSTPVSATTDRSSRCRPSSPPPSTTAG
ncbi:carbon-nitrogen hydrolase family protein [Streptomyces tremellae]|uniref:Carbon-nitrogen hydrolase family protein n=1 Tax=Streptomyces tremellae TaxID=1124239 RepID=A0ABP7FIB8_9ACTN